MQAPSSRKYVHYGCGLIHIFMIRMIIFKQTGWASPPQCAAFVIIIHALMHALSILVGMCMGNYTYPSWTTLPILAALRNPSCLHAMSPAR